MLGNNTVSQIGCGETLAVRNFMIRMVDQML